MTFVSKENIGKNLTRKELVEIKLDRESDHSKFNPSNKLMETYHYVAKEIV